MKCLKLSNKLKWGSRDLQKPLLQVSSLLLHCPGTKPLGSLYHTNHCWHRNWWQPNLQNDDHRECVLRISSWCSLVELFRSLLVWDKLSWRSSRVTLQCEEDVGVNGQTLEPWPKLLEYQWAKKNGVIGLHVVCVSLQGTCSPDASTRRLTFMALAFLRIQSEYMPHGAIDTSFQIFHKCVQGVIVDCL